jgi:phage gp36-like protein
VPSQYASLSDLTTFGAPATALNTPQLTPAIQTGALIAASAVMDTYFTGRYGSQMPFTAWGVELNDCCARIAVYQLLSVRGFNPASAADINIRNRYLDAIDWLNKVQRQAIHPNVTPTQNASPQTTQPLVISSSVINVATGGVAANRGW